MDRETAVKLFAELNRGAPDGVVSGRVLEAFATAVERMTLVAQVGNMERGIAAADARVVGAVAAERERIAKGWDGCVHEGVPCNVDIGASIRAGELVPWASGA